jgi:hypothetical protein
VVAAARPAQADVCVWRDPDRTMARLFPEARDYLTVTKKVTPQVVARMERELGARLDDSEKAEFNFYELRLRRAGKTVTVGTAMALAGKGEYGAIEVVIGLDPQGRIRAAYIQRSREKANQAIRSDSFLGQFVGKSVEDPLRFGKDLRGLDGAQRAAEAVRLTIRKMLLFERELRREPDIEERRG